MKLLITTFFLFGTLGLLTARADSSAMCKDLFRDKPSTLEKWFNVSTLDTLVKKEHAIVYENGYVEIRISEESPTAIISKTSFDKIGTMWIQEFRLDLSGKLFSGDIADPNLVTIKYKNGVLVISSGDPSSELHYKLESLENGTYNRKKIYQKTEQGIFEIQGDKIVSFQIPGGEIITSNELPITGKIVDFKRIDKSQLQVYTSDGYSRIINIVFATDGKPTGFNVRRPEYKLDVADEAEFLVHQRMIEKGNFF